MSTYPSPPASSPRGPSTPSSTPTTPLRQITLTADDMKSPAMLNSVLNDYGQLINYLLGHSGPVKIVSSYDFNGNQVKNVGAPRDPADVVSALFASQTYGPAAIRPSLEALGKTVLQTVRRLNDPHQRENYSSFLNGILNTAPTANTSTIIPGSPGGGTVPVTITAGLHQRVDGSVVPYSAFNDTLTLPTSFALTSLTRTSGVVAAVTSVANSLVANQSFSIPLGGGLTNFSFVGTFVVVSVTDAFHFSYQQLGQPDATATGGSVSLGGVYYYSIGRGQNVLSRTGPFTSDLWTNRVQASTDGETLVATVVVNSQGVDVVNSAAGATPPQTGTAVPVIRRI